MTTNDGVFVAGGVSDVLRLYGDLVDSRAWGRRAFEQVELLAGRLLEGHRATLLHYLAANGVEIYRQRVPRNAADVAALLLQRGADPNAEADMYGGGQRTRGLVITSSHPREAGVTGDLLRVLDGAGAC